MTEFAPSAEPARPLGTDELRDKRFHRLPAGVVNQISLAYFLAWYDVRHRYARSVIGPFWITLQTAIFVGCIGFVFSEISQVSVQDFLPYFSVSFVMWNFLAGATNNATTALLSAGGFIKDRGLPAYVFFVQCFFRHLLFLAHNAVVPLALFLVLGGASLTGAILAIPGFVIFAGIVLCVSLIAGALATRFRDVQPLVESVVNLAFLASPIMWKPDLLASRPYLLHFNPVVHLLAIWRAPLLGEAYPFDSLAISIVILVATGFAAVFAVRRLRRAAFWI